MLALADMKRAFEPEPLNEDCECLRCCHELKLTNFHDASMEPSYA